MAEYLSPGVYVEEYDNSPRTIEGVGTSTAGFVGMAVKGPVIGAPSLVTSFADFTRQYGGYLSEFTHGEYRYLAYSVEQFFINGGTRCYVSRVIPSDARAAEAKNGILTMTAANEGKWGNRLMVTLGTVAKKKLHLVAKEGEKVYTARSTDGFKEGDIVIFDEEYNRIQSIFDNSIIFENEFTESPVDNDVIPKKFLLLVEMDMLVRYNEESEVYTGLNFNPVSPNYIATRLSVSQLIRVTVSEMNEIANPVEAIMGQGLTNGIISFEGGSDGTMEKADAGTFIGEDKGPGKRTGLAAFLENNVVSMMAVPGITIPEVVVALTAQCENLGNRFAVIDMPKELVNTKDLIEYRGMIDSTYAAMYHPWIQIFDRSARKPGYIPPSGAILGIYARTDIARGVHKAPANETVLCTGLSTNYTKNEQDILNPEGINLIRMLPGQGIRVWGARTASSNSAFKYVNVRRLFIYVEESIKANTNWVVFEPNDSTLWTRVQITISSFLDSMWRSGMLAGGSPAEAFFVEIGSQTMTREDVMSGRLICNVGIAPSRPAEFVIFRVTQHTSEAAGG